MIAGAGAVIAGVTTWLWMHGLAGPFLFAMRRAPEGKGGVGRSLIRPVTLLLHLPGDAIYSLVARDTGHDGEAADWAAFSPGAGLNENSGFRQSIARLRIDGDEVCPLAVRVTSMRRCSRESSL